MLGDKYLISNIFAQLLYVLGQVQSNSIFSAPHTGFLQLYQSSLKVYYQKCPHSNKFRPQCIFGESHFILLSFAEYLFSILPMHALCPMLIIQIYRQSSTITQTQFQVLFCSINSAFLGQIETWLKYIFYFFCNPRDF